MKMTTETKIAGIPFESYVCNASGPKCTIEEELNDLGKSGSSAIVMKTCTMKPREGNPEPRSKIFGSYDMVQSMGLPNLGYEKYIEMSKRLKKWKKPVIASIAGFNVDEYQKMYQAFDQSYIDLIEVNVGCPNIAGKPIVGYDFEQMEDLLMALSYEGDKPIGLKLPPYFDPAHWDKMAELILGYDIAFITCVNSLGNTLLIDPYSESTVIKPKKGFAGLSGKSLEPIALANVRAFYERLEGKVSIFGVGGVIDGTSAFKFLLAGADAVQVATAFEIDGPTCFDEIDFDLAFMMKMHDYNSIEEAKGKLKFL